MLTVMELKYIGKPPYECAPKKVYRKPSFAMRTLRAILERWFIPLTTDGRDAVSARWYPGEYTEWWSTQLVAHHPDRQKARGAYERAVGHVGRGWQK